MTPVIGISIGDINGIGPEIVLKALRLADQTAATPLIVSPFSVVDYYLKALDLGLDVHRCSSVEDIQSGTVNVLEFDEEVKVAPGKLARQSGLTAMRSIEITTDLALDKTIDAMVTAPISKEAVNLAGYKIPGHTEFLAERSKADSVLMMLVNKKLRVALNTVHIPIAKVAGSISTEGIIERLSVLNTSLRIDFGIKFPKIAVLGLNPHAGDGGIIGHEEIEMITPALILAKSQDIDARGPFPADGFFGQKLYTKFDAILAMYHDQGLAPFKLLSFGSGVNFSAGLPIIRTSPDHGTAFDIAGKGIADPSSFTQAYILSTELARKRSNA